MKTLNRKQIRKIFYLAFICILITQTIYSYIIYKMDIDREYIERKNHVVSEALAEQKRKAELVVKTLISNIEYIEDLLTNQYLQTADELLNQLSDAVRTGKDEEQITELVDRFPFNQLEYQVIDVSSNDLISNTPSDDLTGENSGYIVSKSCTVLDKYRIHVYLLYDEFYKAFYEIIRSLFYESSIIFDNKICLNQVVDSEMNDRYAKCIIYPANPSIEKNSINKNSIGCLRKRELEVLKSQDSFFNDYYSDHTERNKGIRTLSYSMIYRNFGWVIRTEMSLKNLDEYIMMENVRLMTLQQSKSIHMLKLIFIALLISSIIFYFLELRISRYIKKFEIQLNEEKEKLSRAYLKMKDLAFIDSLTGLYNRRAMLLKLEEEISHSRRNQQSFCIALCDIDKFKVINDSYGHEGGDYILQELAKIMRTNLRLEDRIARWGGEEFLIFINDADREKGRLVSEKIRQTVENTLFIYSNISIKVTLTFGVCVSQNDLELKDQINIADQNMYRGKRSARNCVVI